MMTLDKATDILRTQKFKATKPKDKKMMPKFMQEWDDAKIDRYYKEQEDYCKALDLAISTISAVSHFRKASYELVEIFDNLEKEKK